MKRQVLFFVCLCAVLASSAKWLPASRNVIENPGATESMAGYQVRVLDCQYDGCRLVVANPVSDSDRWAVDMSVDSIENGIRYDFIFTALKPMKESGVAVAFDRSPWTSDNYVMIPASVYNGNRQRLVNRSYASGLDPADYRNPGLALTSNPIPQLSPEFGAPSMIEVSVCNAATPAIAVYERKSHTGAIFLSEQGIASGDSIRDHALIVEESPDRSMASIVFGVPGVREKKAQFIGFTDSPDRGIDFKPGDTLSFSISRLLFPDIEGPTGLLAHFMDSRKMVATGREVRNLVPMSEVQKIMNSNIDSRFLTVNDSVAFYRPEEADWMAYGWIGGLINTYPMLAIGDDIHRKRVVSTFDFALPNAKGASGYYYDILLPDGTILNRDAAAVVPGIGLTRRNGDVLYWMVKQLDLLNRQGHAEMVKPDWEEDVRRLADAFVKTWETHETWGNYLDVESGDIAVFRTTGGASAIGGLALASRYFNNPKYIETAREAAKKYYDEFALVGFTSGGCGDILQNADSETAIALCTSLVTLFEITGENQYLNHAMDLANLCATWTVSWDYRLPSDTPLARLGAVLTGAVWASTQNKHGAPGFCTLSGDALFKIYRATGNSLYADLLRDIIHAHAEGIQPNGRISERLTYCDADHRGSRADGWLTGWNETNGALMAIEIPGIYLRTDNSTLFVFDHVEAQIVKRTEKFTELKIHNPTAFPAEVTIFAEDSEAASHPLGENAFLTWNEKVKIAPGKTVTKRIRHR